MHAWLIAFAMSLVVCWALAVLGTALLIHTIERRTAPYRADIPLSIFERPVIASMLQLARALGRPSVWGSGLGYALRLLIGRDAIDEMTEHEVEAWWTASSKSLPTDASRRAELDERRAAHRGDAMDHESHSPPQAGAARRSRSRSLTSGDARRRTKRGRRA